MSDGNATSTITAPREVHPAGIIPAWASAYGDDPYGIWAELHLVPADGGDPVVQRMRYIEPGTFWMGAQKDEPERQNLELPRHLVTITRGFWLADTACTQALWVAVMKKNPSSFKGDDRPVESISWDDVQNFLTRLKESVPACGARLPTEAEWEYACRAGTATPFWFGDTIATEQVNYDGNYPYAGGAKGQYRKETVPVTALPCNGWGLYQMHGNVWEWCADGRREYEPREVAVENPEGPADRSPRALRGGSWDYEARRCRSACRLASHPDDDWLGTGFRLALSSVDQAKPDNQAAAEQRPAGGG